MTKKNVEFPYFSPDTDLIRQSVRKFCATEIAPYAEAWDKAGIFPKELFKKAGDLGIFGLRLPSAYGGSDLDWWATTAYIEELPHTKCAAVNMALMVQSDMTLPVVDKLGTPEQKDQFLKPCIAGDAVVALGVSEPGGGSDVAALQCRARRVGDEYIISGQKLWITNGSRADVIILAARTGGEGHKGISFFTFPTDAKGFSVGKLISKVGNLASDTAELFFDECRIPARYILGEENRGFYYVMNNFQGERLVTAIHAVALLDAAIKESIEYGKERRIFGKPVVDNQVWVHRLSEHLTSVEAARWLTYRAVDLYNRGKPAIKEITMAKLFATDLAQKVVYDCMQIHGGFGYATEYPIGRLWRDVRLYTVGAGASEVMKEIIWKTSQTSVAT